MYSWSCEQWIVIGNFRYTKKNYDKALLYGERALELDKRNIEAFILKANSLIQLKCYHEAVKHCTEALQLCPFRYTLHKCLIDCYIQTNRLREAEAMAINACKQLNYTPQSYMVTKVICFYEFFREFFFIVACQRFAEGSVVYDENGAEDIRESGQLG